MWTVSHTVGKLIEARIARADSAEVTECLSAIARAVASADAAVVGVLDLSQVRVLAREEAELFLRVMRENNPRVTRTAIVVQSEALLEMQLGRLVRAAAMPGRKVFASATPALAWLSQVLSATETARLRAFFAE